MTMVGASIDAVAAEMSSRMATFGQPALAGIAYGPTFVFGPHIRRGELVALLPTYRAAELAIQAVYPSARRIPLKVRRFVDYLAEAFGDEPAWDRS